MNAEMDPSIDVQQALEFAKQSKGTPPTKKNGSIDLDKYNHGDVVDVGGIPGIVIDREKKLRDIAENDEELRMMKTLLDPNDPTFSNVDPAFNKPPELQAVMDRYLNEHLETKMKRAEVQKAFAGWEIGGNGELVPANDPRAKLYREAMKKIQTGEVVLPTVEEYEKQEKEAKERYKQMADRQLAVKQEVVLRDDDREQPVEEKEEVVTPAVVPNPILEVEEMNMSAEERQKTIESAQADPMVAAIAAQQAAKEEAAVEPKVESVPDETPETTEEQKATEQQVTEPSKPAKPIDLFAAKEQLDAMQSSPKVVQEPKQEPKKDTPDVVINVPQEKAGTFLDDLRPRTEAAIQTAKTIKVNFTKDLNLPKVTRRITDIDSYRSVAPKNVSADITPRILVNSGYVGYFKPCGALKWSRLAPAYNEGTGEFDEMDQGKMVQFCYEQLATTSIGNLGYRQFLENTSSEDIPSMLHAIMGASLPDEQEVMLNCGNCGEDFETTYSIAELPDYDDMAEETVEQVQKIQNAKDMIEDAKDVHDESPVMLACPYTADSTGSVFVFKHADLGTVVDRQGVSKYLAERYGTSASLLSVVITEVRIKTGEEWSVSTDPTVICEELLRLSRENLDEMKAIVDEIPMIPSITYSFKGTKICPNCGQELTQLRQYIQTLVFQIALKAQYFV